MSRINPFLWFDSQAEEAAELYVSLFENSEITGVSRYPEGSPMPAGTALGVTMVLDGLVVQAMNGGPGHPHTEAFSFFVNCETQQEIDRLWDALIADGGAPGRCGWLTDRFGLSWQIIPPLLGELFSDPDQSRSGRVMQAMLAMDKIDIAALQAAADGS